MLSKPFDTPVAAATKIQKFHVLMPLANIKFLIEMYNILGQFIQGAMNEIRVARNG